MIVCKRPFCIHDIDVVGAGVLGVLVAATWFLAVQPWRATWHEYATLRQQHDEVQTQLQSEIKEVDRYDAGLATLRDEIRDATRNAPTVTDMSQLLRRMTDRARAANVDIRSVVPEPATRSGDYVITDIRVKARGTSRDFVRFLDGFAAENTYHQLRHCALQRSLKSLDENCEIDAALRFFLLPTVSSTSEEEKTQ